MKRIIRLENASSKLKTCTKRKSNKLIRSDIFEEIDVENTKY